MDLLLSSGFLAFARHVGVLRAVEERGVAIDAVVGTSSGALVGALWAAGMPARAIEAELRGRRPLSLIGAHARVWEGAFSLDPLVAWLEGSLPSDFAGLARPFAAGVTGPDGTARLLTSGRLPEAVAASCAIPALFAPVEHGGTRWRDGGVVDRLMVGPWRTWRGERRAIAHLVDRTGGTDGEAPPPGVPVIRTPRSGASFWSLGDVGAAVEVARARALATLDALEPR
ncbi:MAG: patatin-like phospholipase family protein [Myxococcota bacterium]